MDKNLSTLLTFFVTMIILAVTIVLNRLKKESLMVPQQVIFSCAFSYDLEKLDDVIDKIRSEAIQLITNRFLMRWPAKMIAQNLVEFVNWLKAEELQEFFDLVNKPGEEQILFTFGFKFFGRKLRITGGFCVKSPDGKTVLYSSDPHLVNMFDVFSEIK